MIMCVLISQQNLLTEFGDAIPNQNQIVFLMRHIFSKKMNLY